MKIHPLAVVSPGAKLGCDVEIGPFCIVESDVELGDGCILESHVVVKSGTTLGAGNHVFEGAVVGGIPQHVNMPEQLGRVRIGCDNTIREHVTIHRSMYADGVTVVGNGNMLMVGCHIAHDCRVGDHCIFANGVLLAGHVAVEDRAFLSGAVAVHQFCRIGSLAMVGGHARVVRDVPPFVTVDGGSGQIVGLNSIGLRRNGYTSDKVAELKRAYRLIYRSGLAWKEMLEVLRSEFPDGPAARFHEFFANSKRGFTAERRGPALPTIKLQPSESEDEPALLKRKAG